MTNEIVPSQQNHWIILAIASGTFAALNGLFAKLTTTNLTSSLSGSISQLLNLSGGDNNDTVTAYYIELICRVIFFGLNSLSNIAMWALFTRALTASPSTTEASITNTTSNFLVTAILGMLVFGEEVHGLWWLGATMMAAGCLLVGVREGQGEAEAPAVAGKKNKVEKDE